MTTAALAVPRYASDLRRVTQHVLGLGSDYCAAWDVAQDRRRVLANRRPPVAEAAQVAHHTAARILETMVRCGSIRLSQGWWWQIERQEVSHAQR